MFAYADGEAWAAGPHRIYRLLADAAVDRIAAPMRGFLALDAGAGTGAAGDALAARGCRVVAADLSPSMLRAGSAPGVVADVGHLPFAGARFDVAAAAFVLSHLADPATGLTELSRVTRPGGFVLVTAFEAGVPHPVKAAVEAVLADAGYRSTDWYADLKLTGEAHVGASEVLADLAAKAGLTDAAVDRVEVGLGGLPVGALAAWRLGMAPVAPFVRSLDDTARARLVAAATSAVASLGAVRPIVMLVLQATV
jgi:ubiquinone/menaquinone biosynthesis C-methylase UbiE